MTNIKLSYWSLGHIYESDVAGDNVSRSFFSPIGNCILCPCPFKSLCCLQVMNLRSQVARAAVTVAGSVFLYLKRSAEPDMEKERNMLTMPFKKNSSNIFFSNEFLSS